MTAADTVVVGDWHLASVTAAGLVELGYRVDVWAGDAESTQALVRGERAAGEAGIAQRLGSAGGNCRPLTDEHQLTVSVGAAGFVLIAFDSSTTRDGAMIDRRPTDAVRQVWQASAGKCPILLSSQVRAGTCDDLLRELAGTTDDDRLVHVPENLRLGVALSDFLAPERLVLGCNGTPPAPIAQFIRRLRAGQLIDLRLIEAELVKHGTNAFLAMCIAFANDLGWIARGLGADAGPVLDAVRADPRVGRQAPLRPGDAYSGATLQRDVRALDEHGRPFGRDGLFAAVSRSNAVHGLAAVSVLDRMLDGVDGRSVCLLGLTYKPNVSTLRDSPALRLAEQLALQGCRVTAYDQIAEPLPDTSAIERCVSMDDAVAGVDCVMLMTPHDDIRLAELAATRPTRALLFDVCGAGTAQAPAGWHSVGLWQT